jgi:hypothetical protein
MKQEYKIVDGWEIVPKSHVQNLREVISREGDNGVEQDRVMSIVEDLFTDAPEEVGYYFSECHWGVEGFMDPEDFYNTWDTEGKWSTVYDSSWLVNGPDSGYNIIQRARGVYNEKERSRNIYIALSLNGSNLASALTEYYMFTLRWDEEGNLPSSMFYIDK